jgi:16S rRNA (guanine527-N7)-methyltransferase
MLSASAIASLLEPYKNAPRGTILLAEADSHPKNAPRGTITPTSGEAEPPIAPRGTITPLFCEAESQDAPRGTNPATNEPKANGPRGTIRLRGAQPDWPHIYNQLSIYLELLLKWNARTNLTAIRDPEEIVRRHFGESIFTGLALAESGAIVPRSTLLDFGSGAGFPGLPIQLLYPELHVTLAESQGKKAAFLHEAIRSLAITAEVWANRVEPMPSTRRFDVTTLRAVDNMGAALTESLRRATSTVAILTTSAQASRIAPQLTTYRTLQAALPNSSDGILVLATR